VLLEGSSNLHLDHLILGRHVGDVAPKSQECREGFNYKWPHPCDPAKDCTFVVKWRLWDEGDDGGNETARTAEYHVMAKVSALNKTSCWIALGFSSNSQMVSQVCWKEGL